MGAPRSFPRPTTAGRDLRLIHEVLRDYDGPALPATGHVEDVEGMLAGNDSADANLLRMLAARRPDLDGQALHGDAHLGNVLRAGQAQYWHDFECTCHGPREYDLAALMLHDPFGENPAARAALAAYGGYDADLVHELVPVYAAWLYASLLAALPRRPELAPVVEKRLRWLRRYA